ncbi:hypothetical protein BDZ94DRAFT_974721 [Collybia nuda]|uniref:Uncharacterized protein n=1 Tax=Collybia nuda TaxID=64659 RepID=A0A9P5YFK8_9AGAR|nr:hypothetical protein BDZ94DRAFT_974721 [Collybia nuda]
MLSIKYITSVFAFAALASAAPTEVQTRSELATPVVTVCTGSLNPRAGCVDIPVIASSCVNFLGGNSFLNDEVSNAQIPAGITCTFFANFGCLSITDFDVALLTGGLTGNVYNLFNVPGISGPLNFNDMTSSFICSPLF